jgi:hypothetical protein
VAETSSLRIQADPVSPLPTFLPEKGFAICESSDRLAAWPPCGQCKVFTMTCHPVTQSAMKWTLLDFGNDLMIVVPAFSQIRPDSASVRVLAETPEVASGAASRLALTVRGGDVRGARTYPLDLISERAQRAVAAAPLGSVVIVEEETARPGGRRFAYVAPVIHDDGGAQS